MHLNYYKGKLNIKIVSALLERDTEVFGKMDPYVTMAYEVSSGEKYKLQTKTHQDGGKTPEWNEEFNFDIRIEGWDSRVLSYKDHIIFRVWDEDTFGSDPVGFASIKISQLCFNGGQDHSYKIFWVGKRAGTIRIISTYVDEERDKAAI